MSIKIQFVFSRLDKFPENLGAISDEQGERFHRGFMTTEGRYQGRGANRMLSDYCWSTKCDCSRDLYKRKSHKCQIFALIQVLASRFCIISNMFKLLVYIFSMTFT